MRIIPTALQRTRDSARAWTDPRAGVLAAVPGRFAAAVGGLAVLLLAAAGCQPEQELELPAPSDLEGLYGERTEVGLTGNVVDVEATQDPDQLRRGGSLWARVGPYIYAFSPQTQEIFQKWNGVAAVRVRTVTPDGTEIARAMLRRDELTSVTWREAKAHVVRARKEGTEKPGYLDDLVGYGEDHTQYEYSEQFVEQ